VWNPLVPLETVAPGNFGSSFKHPSWNIADDRQGLMKGYISREHAMVVLNKKGAFPVTGV
jgi:hypothetical protein